MADAEVTARVGLMWYRWWLLLVRLGFTYDAARGVWISPEGEVCGE